MKSKLRILGMLLTVAVMVFAIGCSDDENSAIVGADMGDGSMLRVIHNSPDAPAVDIYAQGVPQPLATNVKYGDVTPYLEIAEGNYVIELRGAGSPATSQPAFSTPVLAIPDGVTITAMAAGLFGSSADADKFRVLTFVEGFQNPGAGNAAVRIIHASPDAPSVAIDVNNDGTPEVPNFARFGDTGAAGVALPANTEIQIGIWAGSPLARVTAFTTPELPEGGELLVIASGLLGKLPRETDGFSLLAVGPNGKIGVVKQNPVVFALHGSPDAPPVDIKVGGTQTILVGDLAFGELSEAVQVPPAAYTLDFSATGQTGAAATATTPALAAGERYLAIASGFLTPEGGAEGFQLLAFADDFDLGSLDAVVRVIHASPDAPRVDVGPSTNNIVTPVPDFSDLGFKDGSNSAGTALPSGPLTIGIAGANTTAAVATFDVTISGGLRAFANAVGTLGTDGESFRLVVVDTSVFPWAAAEVQPNP